MAIWTHSCPAVSSEAVVQCRSLKWRVAFCASLVRSGSAACSRRRLDGKKLTLAHRNKAGREPGVGLYQCDERNHLVHMRGRVIHDQQASRSQKPTQMWPPAGIRWSFRIEKDYVV